MKKVKFVILTIMLAVFTATAGTQEIFSTVLGVHELKIYENASWEIDGVHCSVNSRGLDMEYRIAINSDREKNTSYNNEMGQVNEGIIKVSLSNPEGTNSVDGLMGFYYDFPSEIYAGLETSWYVDNDVLRFSLRPSGKLKLGENGYIKGWYDLQNLWLGDNPTNHIYFEIIFSWKF
jgi:hypothetical protein